MYLNLQNCFWSSHLDFRSLCSGPTSGKLWECQLTLPVFSTQLDGQVGFHSLMGSKGTFLSSKLGFPCP